MRKYRARRQTMRQTPVDLPRYVTILTIHVSPSTSQPIHVTFREPFPMGIYNVMLGSVIGNGGNAKVLNIIVTMIDLKLCDSALVGFVAGLLEMLEPHIIRRCRVLGSGLGGSRFA